MPNVPIKPSLEILDIINSDMNYYPITGKLYWNKRKATNALRGSEVGGINEKGYRICNVKKRHLFIHHISYYKFYNEWPISQIDHINRIRSDNRILNLRLSNDLLNRWNSGANFSNNTGHLGITFLDKWRKKKYHLDIARKGIRISAFYYTLEEALYVRDKFREEYENNEGGPFTERQPTPGDCQDSLF